MKIQIKQTPGDFIVEEIINLRTSETGKYLYARITKKSLNTLDVVNILMKQLGVPRRFISFAGTKDRNAITTQYFSLQSVKESQLSRIKHPNLKIEFAGYGNNPIFLGSLEANRFTIALDFNPGKITFIPNYFGEQRFSTGNIEIGKAIIKKDFRKAAFLINTPSVKSHLEKLPADFIGAIKTLDKKLISLFINSYQSYLWNEALRQYLKITLSSSGYIEHESLVFPLKKPRNIKIPLVSFDTEFTSTLIKKIYLSLLEKECITLSDFITRQFPDQVPLSAERDAFVLVKNLTWKNSKLGFTLPRGAYATVLIRQIEAMAQR